MRFGVSAENRDAVRNFASLLKLTFGQLRSTGFRLLCPSEPAMSAVLPPERIQHYVCKNKQPWAFRSQRLCRGRGNRDQQGHSRFRHSGTSRHGGKGKPRAHTLRAAGKRHSLSPRKGDSEPCSRGHEKVRQRSRPCYLCRASVRYWEHYRGHFKVRLYRGSVPERRRKTRQRRSAYGFACGKGGLRERVRTRRKRPRGKRSQRYNRLRRGKRGSAYKALLPRRGDTSPKALRGKGGGVFRCGGFCGRKGSVRGEKGFGIRRRGRTQRADDRQPRLGKINAGKAAHDHTSGHDL